MSNTLKKLGDAELEIMQIIWNSNAAVTSNQILKELQERRKWQLSTLMTSLSRLSEKGFVNCDRSTGTNLYTPIISENDYKTKESKNFFTKTVQQFHSKYGCNTVQQSGIEKHRYGRT